MTTTEVWKPIEGYEGLYEVSNLGRVKSLEKLIERPAGNNFIRSEFVMKTWAKDAGYPTVSLTKDKKRKLHMVHRLVAEAFIPNPDNKEEVNHKDYNKKNNNVSNLEWMTRKENIDYSVCNRKKFIYAEEGIAVADHYIAERKQGFQVYIKRRYYGTYKTIEEARRVRNEVLDGYDPVKENARPPKKRLIKGERKLWVQKTNSGEHHITQRGDRYRVVYLDNGKRRERVFRSLEDAKKFRDKSYPEITFTRA